MLFTARYRAPEAPPRAPTHAPTDVLPSAEQEHMALLKRMARLQSQMSQLVIGYEAQLRHWQTQLMRQSTLLMLERTRADWGLVGARRPADPAIAKALASAQTHAVICHTGCQMDNDHWRDGEQCKLNGRVCAVVVPSVT